MFKRILVLALFLFGVFWWFGQKDGSIKKGALVDKVQTEVTKKAEDAKSDISDKIEDTVKDIKTDLGKTEKVAKNKVEEVKKEIEEAEKKATEVKTLETQKGEDITEEANVKGEEVKVVVSEPVVKQNVVPKKTYTAPKRTWKPKPVVKEIVKEDLVPDRQVSIKTYMYEWNIDFSKKSFQSGTINFQIKNNGRFSHEFGIETLGTIGKVMPGESKTFTVKLLPGTYEVFSKRRSDYEKGMKDVITVTQ